MCPPREQKGMIGTAARFLSREEGWRAFHEIAQIAKEGLTDGLQPLTEVLFASCKAVTTYKPSAFGA